MTNRAGVYIDGELWLRCPFCGDSERNTWKAHFSINGEGLYHCLRCKASGRAPVKERIAILTKYGMEHGVHVLDKRQDWEEVWLSVLPGPGTTRKTKLPRNHLLTTRGFYDVFRISNFTGRPCGLQLVNTKTRKKKIIGTTGFGLPDDREPSSGPEEPITIVEGPYDVRMTTDVCTFGIPNRGQLLQMAKAGAFVYFMPDGDVWRKSKAMRTLRRNLVRNIKYAVNKGLFVEGAIKIQNLHDDPETVEDGAVELLTAEEFYQWRS